MVVCGNKDLWKVYKKWLEFYESELRNDLDIDETK